MNRIILLLLFASFLCSIQAQKINLPYDFPVKPVTEEWKKLKSGDEMVDASKIPDSVLISLSTEALAKTSLNYPMLNEKYSWRNLFMDI